MLLSPLRSGDVVSITIEFRSGQKLVFSKVIYLKIEGNWMEGHIPLPSLEDEWTVKAPEPPVIQYNVNFGAMRLQESDE